MAVCIQCSSLIVDEYHYFIRNLGQDIVYIIEQHIGNEVTDLDSEICSQCLTQNTRTPATELLPETNVCVWCRSSLFNRRSHSITQGPIRNFFVERISPRQIPPNGLICYGCWVYLSRNVRSDTLMDNDQPAEDYSNRCVRCLYSLSQRRRHPIPEGPVRDEIATRISPRQIPEGGLVCYSCWSSARQHVQRQQRDNDNPEPVPGYRRHQDDVCVWCRISLFRQRTHLLPPGAERDFILTQIHPREIPNNALICMECWTRSIQGVEHLNIENVPENIIPQTSESSIRITSRHFKISTRSSSHCFVPGCNNNERLSVPNYLKKHILKAHHIYIAQQSRVCEAHKINYNWDFLNQDDFSSVFISEEMDEMTLLSINYENDLFVNFENVEEIDEGLFRWWTGVTKNNFLYILQNCPVLTENCKKPKVA